MKDERFTRSDIFEGPKGRQGSVSAWKGPVVSDGCWDCDSFHNTPRCQSRAEGHLGPNQRDTQHLLGQPSPSCLVTLLLCSLPTQSRVQTHTDTQAHTRTPTHTHTHFLSGFLLLCPCVIIDSFSLTAPHLFRACHSLPPRHWGLQHALHSQIRTTTTMLLKKKKKSERVGYLPPRERFFFLQNVAKLSEGTVCTSIQHIGHKHAHMVA